MDFYIRDASTDGKRIIYRCGADLYVYNPESARASRVEFDYAAPQVQRARKFIDAKRFLEDYELSQGGSSLVLIDRGRPFMMENWEGGTLQLGKEDGVRYRLARWVDDDVIMVSDEGEEHLEIYDKKGEFIKRIDGDMGRAYELRISHRKAAISNHRNEILIVDLETSEVRVVDKSDYDSIGGADWSPDGRQIVFAHTITPLVDDEFTSDISMIDLPTGKITPLCMTKASETTPVYSLDGTKFVDNKNAGPVPIEEKNRPLWPVLLHL